MNVVKSVGTRSSVTSGVVGKDVEVDVNDARDTEIASDACGAQAVITDAPESTVRIRSGSPWRM
jgi:hypothetical protein